MLQRLPNYLKSLGIVRGLANFIRVYWTPHARGSLIRLPLRNQILWLRNTPSDTSIFFQVFVKREYDTADWTVQNRRLDARYQALLAAGRTPVIVDAGANIGLASVWFAARYPAARIFAVEPDSGNLAVLRRNVESLPNVTVLEGGVWDKPAQLRIANPEAGAGAFRVVEDDGHIRAYTIDEIVGMQHEVALFIVKIDIEGGEDALFRSNLAWTREPALIVVETHDWLFPGAGTSANLRRCIAEMPMDLLSRGENIFCVRTP